MKLGDLVRWTHPEGEGFGIILEVRRSADQYSDGEAVIWWAPSKGQPEGHTGCYPARHHYMEAISEAPN